MPIVNTRGAASAKAFGFLSKSVLAIDYLVVAGGGSGGATRGGGGGAGLGDVGIKGIGKKSKLDYAKGGKVSSASKRADGCCVKGKTKGRMV